jgi:hypothetical protein
VNIENLKIDVVRTLSKVFEERMSQRVFKGFEFMKGTDESEIIARIEYHNEPHPANFSIRISELDLWEYKRGPID